MEEWIERQDAKTESKMKDSLQDMIWKPSSIAPLAVFRVLFGAVMMLSILRFAAKGWIEEMYIQPVFFFPYFGFEWVQPMGATGMYLVFMLMAVSALGIMLGYRYRLSAVLFFLSFTYVELLDKSNYLNHYYFVSLISFLLIWLPAHRDFSLDVCRSPLLRQVTVPNWTIWLLQFQVGIVYVFAGIAKLNPEWLIHAMPLKLWLPAQAHLPVIGSLLQEEWLAYLFCWIGACYDLFIVFFLMNKRTRPWAYAAVILFHGMTAMLFQIGMFPYIMMLMTLIFFPASFHERFIGKWRGGLNAKILQLRSGHALRCKEKEWSLFQTHQRCHLERGVSAGKAWSRKAFYNVFLAAKGSSAHKSIAQPNFGMTQVVPRENENPPLKERIYQSRQFISILLSLYLLIQILLPFRYVLYPDNLFWTEEGYRFSWRVMLMEKAGYTVFNIADPFTGKHEQVQNYDYLTPNQEKMMSTQPDMIVQFAHFLKKEYQDKGFIDPVITTESYVSLNGRRSRLFIDPDQNLAAIQPSFAHKEWILPYEPEE